MPSRPARSKHDRLIPSHRADGWEPLEILRGMDAPFTLRSVAVMVKVAGPFPSPSVLSEPTKPSPNPGAVAWLLANAPEMVINSIVLGEIEYGILMTPDGRKRRRLQEWFSMGVQKLHVLNFDAATDAPWARLLAAMPIKDSPTATSALAFDLMLMIVDGASWPVAKALVVPENIQPFDCAQGTRCTGCQPMLPNSVHINPAGRVEHEFSNRVFVGMEGVVRQLATTRRCGRSGRATA